MKFANLIKLIPIIISSITVVENLFRGRNGKGPEKKEAYIEAVMAALGITEGITNKDLIDDEKFKKIIGKLGDDFIEVNNFIRDFKK